MEEWQLGPPLLVGDRVVHLGEVLLSHCDDDYGDALMIMMHDPSFCICCLLFVNKTCSQEPCLASLRWLGRLPDLFRHQLVAGKLSNYLSFFFFFLPDLFLIAGDLLIIRGVLIKLASPPHPQILAC